MTSVFDHYGPVKTGEIAKRTNGVMYAMTLKLLHMHYSIYKIVANYFLDMVKRFMSAKLLAFIQEIMIFQLTPPKQNN